MRFVVTVLFLFIFAALATAAPAPPRPPIQVLDEMSTHLRAMQAAMQKETQPPGDQWQDALGKQIEKLSLCVNELSRAGVHSGMPPSTYGLRMFVNNLRSARDPGQALERTGQLAEIVSFLRTEHQLAAQHPVPPPAPEPSRAKAREAALDILKRSEFHQATKPHFFDYYLNRVIVKVIAWFQGLFDSTAMTKAGTFAYLLLWLVYALVGFAVVWFVYRTWTPRRKIVTDEPKGENTGITLLTPEIHLAEAEALYRAGNHAGAVREYFLMMLATLEQRNLVARNRSWTNWEYLLAFGERVRDESARDRMSQLNLVYDQVGYGGARCDEKRFTDFRQSVDSFLSALPTTPA